jgi:hypothetical protein
MDVDPLIGAAGDGRCEEERLLPLDDVDALDAEGLARAHDGRAVVGIVRRVEDDLDALEARRDDGEQALAPSVEHQRLEQPDRALGSVGLDPGNSRGEEVGRRDDAFAVPSHMEEPIT